MMCHTLKISPFRLGVSALYILGLMAMTLTGQSAFAASCAGPGTPFDATCTVHLSTYYPSGSLAFTSDANATMPANGSVTGTNSFQFNSTVYDDRGIASGWKMQAASAGLISPASGNPAIPLSITGILPGVSTGSSCGTAGPFFDGTVTTPLNGTASTYARMTPVGTTAYHCTIPFTTLGSYTIPANSAAGTYQGDITLTLSNTAAG